jgi:hypothetical protein
MMPIYWTTWYGEPEFYFILSLTPSLSRDRGSIPTTPKPKTTNWKPYILDSCSNLITQAKNKQASKEVHLPSSQTQFRESPLSAIIPHFTN